MDTNQVPRHESEHLSADTLAELAEDPRAAVDKRHLAHLAQCRSCMAAYADAVRYRTAWLGSRELFEETEDKPETSRPSSAKLMKRLPYAAGLIVAIGIGGWLLMPRAPRAPAPVPQPIAALLERASSEDLVLPGGELGAAEVPQPYREGEAEDRATREAIEVLRTRYESGVRSVEDLYVLSAALVASGRTDLAFDYIQEGHKLDPRHTGFLLLNAVVARRDGRLDPADDLFRRARAIRPADLTLILDHAILLGEMGRATESEDLLREVIRRSPGSPLARRAERILSSGVSQ